MPVIDLMAGLREVSSTRGATGGGGISKAVLEINAPELLVNLNEPELAGAFCLSVVAQVKTNILSGAKLDGTPAQALAASTIERREYRILQGQRGGEAAARYKDRELKRNAKKHWRKNYTAPRAGTFNPATKSYPDNLRAVESGLLIDSMAAEPTAGGAWKIFFANIRAQTDRSGNSPVGRAFGMAAQRKAMYQRVVTQPGVKKRLEFALQKAIGGKKGANLLAELQKTATLASGLAGDLES